MTLCVTTDGCYGKSSVLAGSATSCLILLVGNSGSQSIPPVTQNNDTLLPYGMTGKGFRPQVRSCLAAIQQGRSNHGASMRDAFQSGTETAKFESHRSKSLLQHPSDVLLEPSNIGK